MSSRNETRRPTRARASWLALFLATALVGCGGGGGGSDGAAPQPSNPSGLVPVAPEPGVVLHADATVLRPQRVGAIWRYRGADRPLGSGTESTYYTNEVTLAANSAGSAGAVIQSAQHGTGG